MFDFCIQIIIGVIVTAVTGILTALYRFLCRAAAARLPADYGGNERRQADFSRNFSRTRKKKKTPKNRPTHKEKRQIGEKIARGEQPFPQSLINKQNKISIFLLKFKTNCAKLLTKQGQTQRNRPMLISPRKEQAMGTAEFSWLPHYKIFEWILLVVEIWIVVTKASLLCRQVSAHQPPQLGLRGLFLQRISSPRVRVYYSLYIPNKLLEEF